jgi:hypothetical protein
MQAHNVLCTFFVAKFDASPELQQREKAHYKIGGGKGNVQ